MRVRGGDEANVSCGKSATPVPLWLRRLGQHACLCSAATGRLAGTSRLRRDCGKITARFSRLIPTRCAVGIRRPNVCLVCLIARRVGNQFLVAAAMKALRQRRCAALRFRSRGHRVTRSAGHQVFLTPDPRLVSPPPPGPSRPTVRAPGTRATERTRPRAGLPQRLALATIAGGRRGKRLRTRRSSIDKHVGRP